MRRWAGKAVDAADDTSGKRTPLLVAGELAVCGEFAESSAVFLRRPRNLSNLESSARDASRIMALWGKRGALFPCAGALGLNCCHWRVVACCVSSLTSLSFVQE